jgi:hypothetical protein
MDRFSFGLLALLGAIGGPAVAAPTADAPASVAAPAFKIGDSWVFDQTTEKGQTGYSSLRADFTVERIDSDTIALGEKRDGAPIGEIVQIIGADWSRRLVVAGKDVVTNRPFAFPMSLGQSWTSDWTDPTRRGNLLSLHAQKTCTPVDWEDVTVPAGAFHALKVVCKGVDEATLEVPAQTMAGAVAGSAGATSIAHAQRGGRAMVTNLTYSEVYYVPAVRNYVKSVDEQYNADNVRLSRIVGVLVSFKPGD